MEASWPHSAKTYFSFGLSASSSFFSSGGDGTVQLQQGKAAASP
jgi:hypothetical protein